jgi:hypothetical protein
MDRKRGKHGCYIHTESQGDNGRWRPVKCSRHHAIMGPPTPGHPTGTLGTVCHACGATVERTYVTANAYQETWTLAKG